ncbi:MAG: Gfo/Idh/MocA family oxidoreductase [Rhodococcus sp. (in: high G+C Gram-positive bacteria)]
MTVRVGVIGVGVMGADHARTLQRSVSGAQVTVVTDFDAARADTLAHELSARTVATATELIAAPDVDAVVIASHDCAHAEQVAACLDQRKPVLCEKPLALSVDECRDLVAKEGALGLPDPLVSVGFMRRFHHPYVALADEVRSGSIGTPLLVRSSHRNVSAYPGGDSAGTITNSAIHEIDVTSWLLGSPIVEVSWHAPRSTSYDTSRQDPQVLLLRTADGALTTVDVFVNARYGYDVRCEVVGETGAVSLAAPHALSIDSSLRSASTYPKDWRPLFADAYRRQLQAWIDALTAEVASPLATARDGLRATQVAVALIDSMNNDGATTTVDYR